MYDFGSRPAPDSDLRFTKATTQGHSSDHESSGSDIEWDRRRKCINNEVGASDRELANKFRSLIEDIKEKEHSKEFEGVEFCHYHGEQGRVRHAQY